MTGKVVMVGVEESQRVKRGQIIARFDDTNAKASVAQASAGNGLQWLRAATDGPYRCRPAATRDSTRA